MLIDAQVHVVSPDRQRYPLHVSRQDGSGWFDRFGRSVEALVAEMDAVGIDRAVLVQAYTAYRFDNRYTLDSAARAPERFACSCIIDLEDDPLRTARSLVDERRVRGIRLFLADDTEWLDSSAADALLSELAALGAVAQFLVHAEKDNLPGLLRAARRHPGLPMLLDHCGFPDLSGGPGYPRAPGLFALSAAGNVRVKLSTQVFDLARRAGVPTSRLTEDLVSAFGAARVLWASDLTVQERSYAAVLGDAREACAGLSGAERDLVLGEAAAALWWPGA